MQNGQILRLLGILDFAVITNIITEGKETANGLKVPNGGLCNLTHWGHETHICVCNLTIIGSNNGLSPGRCQTIIWTNAGLLFFEPFGTYFSEIWIKIEHFSLKKIHLKMSSGKWRPFCLCRNELMHVRMSKILTKTWRRPLWWWR